VGDAAGKVCPAARHDAGNFAAVPFSGTYVL